MKRKSNQTKLDEKNLRIVTGAIMLAAARVLSEEWGFTPEQLARWAELTAAEATKGIPGAVTARA